MLKETVGSKDAKVRFVLGAIAGAVSLAILGEYLQVNQIWSPVLGVIALIALGTAYTGMCPIYSLLGMDTCEADVADGS